MMDLDGWLSAMEANQACVRTMLVFADWMQEQGRDVAAEAIRLLAEAGKVGRPDCREDGRELAFSYYSVEHLRGKSEWVCEQWWLRANAGETMWQCGVVRSRMLLAEAYERADEATRARWRQETFFGNSLENVAES